MRQTGSQRQVMGDVEQCPAASPAELINQPNTFGLPHHVEGCRGFVGHHDRLAAAQAHSEHDALPHTTRKLVWIRLEDLRALG